MVDQEDSFPSTVAIVIILSGSGLLSYSLVIDECHWVEEGHDDRGVGTFACTHLGRHGFVEPSWKRNFTALPDVTAVIRKNGFPIDRDLTTRHVELEDVFLYPRKIHKRCSCSAIRNIDQMCVRVVAN